MVSLGLQKHLYSYTHLLSHTIETFNWKKLLDNKNANEHLYLFNKAMVNIFHSFIPNKNIICNDKDFSPNPQPRPPTPLLVYQPSQNTD